MTDTPARRKPDYLVGLDLGKTSDYSAVCVLERTWHPDPAGARTEIPAYLLGHAQRWPLRTSYPQVVADVVELVKRPPLVNPTLMVDQTGVGAAVVDMFRQGRPSATLVPVIITAGHATTFEQGAWHVPKKELVSVLQALLQTGRLKIAAIPERELLVKELLGFQVKITAAANETFAAWRERDHDDLVLAAALACWRGERHKPQPSFAPFVVGGTRLADGSCPFAGVAAAGYCGSGGRPWFPAGRVAKPTQGEPKPDVMTGGALFDARRPRS
jgi:hypothetical protein